jgi:D-glycero-alpha-D-manno-heptose-7-phosphate kinase
MKFDENILGKNKKLAQEGFRFLSSGKIHKFGELLDNYWQLKKKLNGRVSSSNIDTMYEKAKRAGAIGGKIAGAGGGGFMILMVPESFRKKVRNALRVYREMPFRLAPTGTKVIFDNGI